MPANPLKPGREAIRASKMRSYYRAKFAGMADKFESVPDLSRAETRLAAEVMLAQASGREVPAEVAARAHEVLNTMARG